MKSKLLFFLFLMIPIILSAQEINVSGTVTSAEDGMPIPGVSVQVKGTNKGAVTDFNGKYLIENVNSQATLVFSFLGFVTTEIEIDGENQINVTLGADAQKLDEVILTGYTTQQKSDVAGAISVVESEQLEKESSPNLLTALQGRVAGVNIQSDGTPGGNSTGIVIRGVTSINSGTGPLFVIDGIQTYNTSSINPDEISSMQVLKGGAAAAIYGTRGANGVIIITTKRAEEGAVKMSLKSLTGVQFLRDKIEVLNAEQWAQVKYDSYQGNIPEDLPPYLINNGNGFTLAPFLDEAGLQPTSNTDWVDAIYDPSFFKQIDFSVSAGNENASGILSLNYFKDNGIQKFTGYERFNARLNSSYNPNSWFGIQENLLISNYSEIQANSLEDAALQNPLIPLYDNEGDYGGPVAGLQDKWNPIAILWANQDNKNRFWRILGGLEATVTFTDWLSYSSSFAIDYNSSNFRGRQREFIQAGAVFNRNESTTVNTNNNLFVRKQFTNLLKFGKSFGSHSVNAIIGIERIIEDEEFFFGTIMGIPNNDINNIYLSAGQGDQFTGSAQRQYRLSSQFGQIRYNFDETYYLNATLRRDASSRFGPNKRSAIFPAASFAWRIINEDFLEDQDIFSDMKLRASYAISGNDQIGEGRFWTQFALQSQSSEFANYNIEGNGTGARTGIHITGQGNPDITWEETESINIGANFGLMENRFYVTLDYYTKLTENLLVSPAQPATSGQGAPPFINAGVVSNRGLELVLNYISDATKDFTYGIDLTAAKNVNNVEDLILEGREFFNAAGIAREGSPIGAFYGYKTNGLFTTPEEIMNHPDQTAINGRAPRLGGIRYVDINGDGIVNPDDRTIIGNPYPDLILGLNFTADYKDFDFTAFFDGKFGHELFNDTRKVLDFVQFDFNHGLNTLNAWTPENINSNIPSLTRTNYNETVNSSYFVEKGDYFRLKNITLGYTIDGLPGLDITKLRMYIQGQNLFSLTSFSGFDYETPGVSFGSNVGLAGFFVPHTKSLSAGVNIEF